MRLCLLAEREKQVQESIDYKSNREFEKTEFRQAADTLWNWSRPNASFPEVCPDSLRRALPEWRKI